MKLEVDKEVVLKFLGYSKKKPPKIIEKKLDKELEIFDEDSVSQQEFIDVFITPDPRNVNHIQFKANNLIAIHYLHLLSRAFNNLSHSRLSRSKLFYNKRGKLLNQSDLDNGYSRLVTKNDTSYDKITETINSVLL